MDKQLDRAAHVAKTRAVSAEMDNNARTGVRFGMLPAETVKAAEAEGFNGHQLAVALMDVASSNGDMRA